MYLQIYKYLYNVINIFTLLKVFPYTHIPPHIYLYKNTYMFDVLLIVTHNETCIMKSSHRTGFQLNKIHHIKQNLCEDSERFLDRKYCILEEYNKFVIHETLQMRVLKQRVLSTPQIKHFI